MKQLKLIILTIGLLYSSTNTFFAQSSNDQTEMQNEMKKLIDSLNLSKDQREEFISIQKSFRNKMQSLKKEKVNKFNMFRQYKKNKSERNKQMKVILNDNQYKVYIVGMDKIESKGKKRNKSLD